MEAVGRGRDRIPPSPPAPLFLITWQAAIPSVIPKTEGCRQVNKEVNLTKRVKTPQGLRFCPVVISANGRVKPDYVLIGGKEQRHPEGAYYLEWREGGKRVRQSVGRDASTAAARRHRQQQILGSKAAGIELVDEDQDDGVSLAEAVAGYLEDVRISKKPKTYAAYKKALEYSLESCNKTRVTPAVIYYSDYILYTSYIYKPVEVSVRLCGE